MNAAALNVNTLNEVVTITTTPITLAFTQDQALTSGTPKVKAHPEAKFTQSQIFIAGLGSSTHGFTQDQSLTVLPELVIWVGVRMTSDSTLSGAISAGRPLGTFTQDQALTITPSVIVGPGLFFAQDQALSVVARAVQKVNASARFTQDQQLDIRLKKIATTFGLLTTTEITTLTQVD